MLNIRGMAEYTAFAATAAAWKAAMNADPRVQATIDSTLAAKETACETLRVAARAADVDNDYDL